MYRQNHGDNGHSAQHQDREENFDCHRDLGYQKVEPLPKAFFGLPTDWPLATDCHPLPPVSRKFLKTQATVRKILSP
jgi:hypothetical protein